MATLGSVRKILAWVLPALATLFTLVFFIAMTSGGSWIFRPAFGRFGSLAIVVGLAILVFFAVCVWIYGRLSTEVERRKDEAGAPD